MSKQPLNKQQFKEEHRALRIRKRRKKILILLIALVILATSITAVAFYAGSQRQHLRLPAPGTVQHGTLVDHVNQSFAFEWEWNFNLTQGTTVNMSVTFLGGVAVNVILGPIDDKLNLIQPYLYSGTVKSSNPVSTWTGTIQKDGGYRLELGNVSDESHIATVQVYVHAT